MSWVLIRHGQTRGNLEHRYIGCRTDEPLCENGIENLKAGKYPPVEKVFASPMKRCTETAAIIYPDREIHTVDDFCECDFGDFENMNYAELNGREDYQAWIDSGGEMPFPGGESRCGFAVRCVRAFDAIAAEGTEKDCAVIAHGGTIMAIMEKYARPNGNYFDFQVKNGRGYILFPDGSYEKL